MRPSYILFDGANIEIINPNKLNRLSHPYILGDSISHLRGV